MLAASSPLTKIIPGLMIWTLVFFLIVFFALKKLAFARIQALIDERREQVRRSIEEADNARDEARKLLEEHRQLLGRLVEVRSLIRGTNQGAVGVVDAGVVDAGVVVEGALGTGVPWGLRTSL